MTIGCWPSRAPVTVRDRPLAGPALGDAGAAVEPDAGRRQAVRAGRPAAPGAVQRGRPVRVEGADLGSADLPAGA